ncbi:ABC transporter substrate-binding protein [Streptomyces sp. SBT349]|uniref:ABC transporter substrate-binding protein n=1 Tax=Streptomyces sp. SBT349 TaxID=1580539 RepID=UPI00066B9DEB|nr:ABC transporter substrate-binding protein [Streptomyces sp. SBT349]
MPPTSPKNPSRRSLLAAGGAAGAAMLLAACGDDDGDQAGSTSGSGSGSEQGAGGWTFTDDRDETVTLDARPETIVAFVTAAAALHDYGIEVTGVFGPTSPVDGQPNPQAGEMDVSGLTSLGEAWGEFNIEEYARLEPDLLVSTMFPAPDLWFVPPESQEDILALAPSVGINVARASLLEPITRFAEFAESLGADLSAASVTEARTRFETAAESLRRAARDNPGIKVMAVTGDNENLYIGVPSSYADLFYFAELGVGIVEAEKSDEFGFWEFVSWENADKYHADLIMIDNRTQALTLEQLREKPTFARLPAVEAGQTVPWAMEERHTYAGYAPVIEQLAEAVGNATRLG